MSDFARSHAVVIGINAYSNGIAELQTAANDATVLAEILQNDHGYETTLLLNQSAHRQALLDLFTQQLPQNVTAQDRLLFYFAGHGIARDGDDGPVGYLIPQDAKTADVNSFLPMQTVVEALNALPCRHLLMIIDCCFAGAFRWASTRDIDLVPETIHKQRFDRYLKYPAQQIITSAAHDQKALDLLRDNRGGQSQHSPFAQGLFQALKGEGDLIEDGVISASELYLYLRKYVEDCSEETQTPELWPLKDHDRGEYLFVGPDFERDRLAEAPELNPENNPYRGLKSYDTQHAKLFFGREALIQKLDECYVSKNPLTIVVGASGTGKSSLVKAGLVPYLQHQQILPQDSRYLIAPLRPGSDPLLELAQALLPLRNLLRQRQGQGLFQQAQLHERLLQRLETPKDFFPDWFAQHPSGERCLLILDQGEELITLVQDEERREIFLQYLSEALRLYPDRLRCVMTLRLDFEDLTKQVLPKSIRRIWSKSRLLIPPMSADDLKAAIVGPATEKVLYFEPTRLVDRIIHDLQQMPGALPLMSFVLSELYQKCYERFQSGNLDRALLESDYDQLGGVVGALRQRADAEYEQLSLPEQQTLKNLMLRMVSFEGGELARRRVLRSELKYADSVENDNAQRILRRFVQQRLWVSSKSSAGEYVEPAHDALVRSWEKIREWLTETVEIEPKAVTVAGAPQVTRIRRTSLTLQRQVAKAADRWHSQSHKSSHEADRYLWVYDPRLEQLETIAALPQSWLNAIENKFVQTSARIRDRRRRRNLVLISGTIVFLAAFGLLALNGQRNALRSEIDALGTKSEAQLRSGQSLDALLSGLGAMNSSKNWVFRWLGADRKTQSAAQSALHRAFYQSQEFNRLEKSLAQPGHAYDIFNALPSPDGKRLATTGYDGTVRLWSFDGRLKSTQKEHLDNEAAQKASRLTYVPAAAFSPDSRWLATGDSNGDVILWQVNPEPSAENPLVLKLRISRAHQEERPYRQAVRDLAFSPDGRWLATAGYDSFVRIWPMEKLLASEQLEVGAELAIAQLQGQFNQQPHPGKLWSVDFSPDSQQVAGAYGVTDKIDAGVTYLWNVDDWMGRAKTTEEKPGEDPNQALAPAIACLGDADVGRHRDSVLGVKFNPQDPSQLVTAGRDRKLALWSIDRQQKTCEQTAFSDRHQSEIWSLDISPSGQSIVTGSASGRIMVWEIGKKPAAAQSAAADAKRSLRAEPQKLTQTLELKGHQDIIWSAQFRPRLSIGNASGNASGNISENALENTPENASQHETQADVLVTASGDSTVRYWDWRSKSLPPIQTEFKKTIRSLELGPDQQYLAAGGLDGSVNLWRKMTRMTRTTRSPEGDDAQSDANPNTRHQGYEPIATCQGVKGGIFDLTLDLNRRVRSVQDEPAPEEMSQQPNQRLATVSGMGMLHLFEVTGNTCNLLQAWNAHGNPQRWQNVPNLDEVTRASKSEAHSVAVHPTNPDLLVTSGGDGTLRIWNLKELLGQSDRQKDNPLPKIQIHQRSAWEVTFDADGKRLATVGVDGTVRLWDFEALLAQSEKFRNQPGDLPFSLVKPAALLQSCQGHQSWVLGLDFHPDGTHLVSSDSGGTVMIWDLQEPEETSESPAVPAAENVLINPDDKVATLDQAASLRSSTSGEFGTCRRPVSILSHRGAVYSVRFDAKGQQLAVANSDGTVRLWDLEGNPLAEFAGHKNRVWSIVFGPDNVELLASDDSSQIQVWKLENARELLTLGCQWAGDYVRNREGDRPLCPNLNPGSTRKSQFLSRLKQELSWGQWFQRL